MSQRKIGIMGGTFHPIHNGHLILAENAWQQFGLEQIYFLPTGLSPHKQSIVDDRIHRLSMVELAIAGNDKFSVSTRELYSEEINYTYRTLEILTQENPDTEFYFIMGADSLVDFETWRNPARICQLCKLLVAVRAQQNREQLEALAAKLQQKYQAQIFLLDTPNTAISSREIRERVRMGQTIRYLLPEDVRNYIEDTKLYK